MARNSYPCPFCGEHVTEGTTYRRHQDAHLAQMEHASLVRGWMRVLRDADGALQDRLERIEDGDA